MDRLLPRHDVAPMTATIEWDVRRSKIIWRRDEKSVEGKVTNLSLDGALIEVALDSTHEPGDVIGVRLGGVNGRAVVRHGRLSDDGTARVYGIQWVKTPDLEKAVASGLEQIRSAAGDVRRNWNSQRR